jgi:hypothetical protein
MRRRLGPIVEQVIGDLSVGILKGGSTTYHIFTMKHILEKMDSGKQHY